MYNKLASTLVALAFGSFALVGTAQATGTDYKEYWQCLKTQAVDYHGTIADAACDPALAGVLGTLCVAVDAANDAIGTALSGPGNLTVLAPTNEAFAAVPFLDTLLDPNNQAVLDNVLLYHVVGKPVDPRRSAIPRKVESLLEGQSLFFSYAGNPKVNQSNTSCEAVRTDNWTVWIIDSVLQPQYFPTP
jgi:uncharacterized surface protein with fasciclin (FAS1) repeats